MSIRTFARWACPPSLLNEGVAVYFETLLSDQQGVSLQSLARAWEHLIDSGAVSLRGLCRNDGFWKDYRQDQELPPGGNYQIGGALVAYLVEVHGLLLLKEIFLASHYRDEHLASTLERLVGL
ncbi:MAG TPA: hypothetical protein VGW38_22270, partial [Chloroflexota bacterium]|nr:hypothetical protein [Chloroflexota bacterium]